MEDWVFSRFSPRGKIISPCISIISKEASWINSFQTVIISRESQMGPRNFVIFERGLLIEPSKVPPRINIQEDMQNLYSWTGPNFCPLGSHARASGVNSLPRFLPRFPPFPFPSRRALDTCRAIRGQTVTNCESCNCSPYKKSTQSLPLTGSTSNDHS